jgi:hypothetical protein
LPPEKPARDITRNTLNGYLNRFLGVEIPETECLGDEDIHIIAGNADNNPALRHLASEGLFTETGFEPGEEGFRLFTCKQGGRKYVVIHADSPAGLKHGCQELAFFRTAATRESVSVDWPLNVTMRPVFPYRGVYILPCWSAFDSFESWQTVLRFHSELTLNRNWFWLAGFPLLKEYGGEYEGTDLADPENVRALIRLCHGEAMQFSIGGGWFTWHHAKHAGDSIGRGVQYYLDMLKLLPETDGIFLEPTGEGQTVPEETWIQHVAAMRELAHAAFRDRPEFEFAVAIGKFNDPAYRDAVHRIDDRRLYWWWCWGDPIRENACEEHPLVLKWHICSPMAEYHGSLKPPQPEEKRLTGFATSYDPGQGFGNPWNGWGKLGVDHPRNVHPYTMPFFSHQYRFRERCWNPDQSEEEFSQRLSRRLFDADMPGEAVRHYLCLAAYCPKAMEIDEDLLSEIEDFVGKHIGHGTPRNQDTLRRMEEAILGLRSVRSGEIEGKARQ